MEFCSHRIRGGEPSMPLHIVSNANGDAFISEFVHPVDLRALG